MTERSSKGEILTRIRNALIKPSPKPFPRVEAVDSVFVSEPEPLEVQFALAFGQLGGHFVYNESADEFLDNLTGLSEKKGWNHLFCWEPGLQEFFRSRDFRKIRIGKDLKKADAGITTCEALIARTGSVLLSSAQPSGRSLSIYPPAHLVIADVSQLVPDIGDALELIKRKYKGGLPSMISFSTGPSRTADIEKTLVIGAHGPKEIYVFLTEEPLIR